MKTLFALALVAAVSGCGQPPPKPAPTVEPALGPAPPTKPEGYARPDMLVEPAALMTSDPPFILLDARPKAEYEAGHVLTAQWVDHAEWAKAFADARDADGWAARIGNLAIHPGSTVAVYDDATNKDAARIWFILRYWGVTDVRLVDGGWPACRTARVPTTTKAIDLVPQVFEPQPRLDRFATKAWLLKAIEDKSVQIVDARSENEHCGIDAMTNQKAGAMPGAKHLEWSDLLDKETGRFKPAGELQTLFAAAGIKLDEPTVTHCQAGGRAAVMAFGLELMGAPRVRTYYRSWGEWGNSPDTPVVKPAKK